MNLAIYDDKNKTVFQCDKKSCFPTVNEIKSMAASGYKFKLDNKIISKKKLLEFIGDNND